MHPCRGSPGAFRWLIPPNFGAYSRNEGFDCCKRSADRCCVGVSSLKQEAALCQNCVTYPPETPGKHRDLRGSAEAHRCCGKLLIGSALVGFGVRQHARGESISKRAPSTTRTSLRLESI